MSVSDNEQPTDPRQPPMSRVTSDVVATLKPLSRGEWWGVGALSAVVLWGAAMYVNQLRHGLSVTAMNDYFSWGVYIIDYIFLIGIGMAGTLMSAMLRLTGVKWRHPITRLAEAVTLVALLVAGPIVIVDMGRPDRFFHVLVYGRLQSPILWDVFSLMTYLAGSVLYLYLPMVPDMAILRDCEMAFPAWRRKLYKMMALGWRDTPRQKQRLHRCINIMAVVIIPVAVSLHTITAWIFGMTLRPGWHSSIIGPAFVVGAIYSGIAAVITVMALVRWRFKLEAYLTPDHFKKLSLLLLTMCLIYLYFTLNEYVGGAYASGGSESLYLSNMFQGPYTLQFWSMIMIGLLIPGLLIVMPWTRTIKGIVTASVLVNIGMWLMRYIIVVPTLSSPYMPLPLKVSLIYVPTLTEWSITAAAFSLMVLLFVLFAKLFPIISIWEIEADDAHAATPATTDSRQALGGSPCA